MWNTQLEELRNDLNRKIEGGISLNTEVLEMSQKLDIAINEFYANLNNEKTERLCS